MFEFFLVIAVLTLGIFIGAIIASPKTKTGEKTEKTQEHEDEDIIGTGW